MKDKDNEVSEPQLPALAEKQFLPYQPVFTTPEAAEFFTGKEYDAGKLQAFMLAGQMAEQKVAFLEEKLAELIEHKVSTELMIADDRHKQTDLEMQLYNEAKLALFDQEAIQKAEENGLLVAQLEQQLNALRNEKLAQDWEEHLKPVRAEHERIVNHLETALELACKFIAEQSQDLIWPPQDETTEASPLFWESRARGKEQQLIYSNEERESIRVPKVINRPAEAAKPRPGKRGSK